MAFFLESTFVGLFFFGWDRLGKVQHMAVTWLVALGSNLSALMDPCRQRLDAEPYRIGLQLRNHAYGDGQLL